LIGKKPVMGKVETAPVAHVASLDPLPPPLAPEALAHLPRLPGVQADVESPGRLGVSAETTSIAKKPLQAAPAVRSRSGDSAKPNRD
jgi:hypothetical protein